MLKEESTAVLAQTFVEISMTYRQVKISPRTSPKRITKRFGLTRPAYLASASLRTVVISSRMLLTSVTLQCPSGWRLSATWTG